ncbi:MAG TPA: MoaD/ThiS family protein, partial [Chloroflexota bacterium]|nr:MoaD/ThiS family protein [Chloroflexota bacterium]
MAVVIRIPAPLRRLTDGQAQLRADAATVGDCITYLGETYPGLRERLCEEDGSVRRFINIYVKGEDIRFGQGLETAL